MDVFKKLSEIRREYGDLSLSEDRVDPNPITQFKLWFQEVLKYEKNDPTAMVLSTVDHRGLPDSRIVLLKSLNEDGHFIFYTNYQSAKAKQLQQKPYAALNFFWPEMARQVRVRGKIEPISAQESDSYFSSRPIKSQLSAILSPQSQEIQSRAVLEDALEALDQKQKGQSVARPDYWGGYRLIPEEIEFWQGRNDRLHDRIHYYQQKGAWVYHRLAP